MPDQEKLVAGLDIGTTKICCVVAKHGQHGIEIMGVGQTPSPGVRNGQVLNIEGTAAAVRKAVGQAERSAGTKIDRVIVGIADKTIKSDNCTGMITMNRCEITESDIQRVLESAKSSITDLDCELLHVIPREYRVDSLEGIANPLGMSCSRLEVRAHLVTAGSSSVRNIIKACQRADLQVNSVVLQSLASAHAVLTEDEMELGVALLDIGGGTTDVAVFKHGLLWYTTEIAVAGSHITADLARHLRMLPSDAEQLKVQHGGCFSERGDKITHGSRQFNREDVCNVITARVEELISEVATHTRRSRHGGKLVAGLVITGGTALIPDLDLYLEQLTNVPVRIGTPTGIFGLKDLVNHPGCSTGVGLVTGNLHPSPQIHQPEEVKTSGLIERFGKWLKQLV